MLYNRAMRVGLIPVLLLAAALATLPGCQKMQARSLIKEGNSAYKAGKLREALALFDQARELDPEFPTLHLHLGYTHMALAALASPPESERHWAGAAAAFKVLMRIAPTDDRAPRYYLQVLMDANKLEEALVFLKAQHKANPRDVKTVSSLGLVSSRAGRFDEALGWYEKRAALLPDEAKAHYLIGTLCWKRLYKNDRVLGVNRIRLADRGLAALDRALTIQPDYAAALTYKNLLHRERARGHEDEQAKAKDMEKARAYYKRAMALIKAQADKTKKAKKAD